MCVFDALFISVTAPWQFSNRNRIGNLEECSRRQKRKKNAYVGNVVDKDKIKYCKPAVGILLERIFFFACNCQSFCHKYGYKNN